MNKEREIITCSICSTQIDPKEDEYSLGNGDIICKNCYENNTFICADCYEVCSTDEERWIDGDNKSVCEDCFSYNYDTCDDCGGAFANDDLEDINGYGYCTNCRDENFTTCYNCGGWIHFDDALYSEQEENYYCESCYNELEEDKSLFPYHSDYGREDISNNSRYKIGIEIEKEDEIHLDYDKHEILDETKWTLEEDSSLDSYSGFEAISPVLPFNIRTLQKEFKKIDWIINAKQSTNCGGHIHISDRERQPYRLLEDIRGYLPILYAMYPNRLNRGYSMAKKIYEYKANSHNQAFNPSEKTLELRIFPSPRSTRSLVFRCKLIKYMLNNPENSLTTVINKMVLDKTATKKSKLIDILREVYNDEKILEVIIKAQVYASIYNDEYITGTVSKEQIKEVNNLIKQ